MGVLGSKKEGGRNGFNGCEGPLCERKFNSPTYRGPDCPCEKDLGTEVVAVISRIKANGTTIAPPPTSSLELPTLPAFANMDLAIVTRRPSSAA